VVLRTQRRSTGDQGRCGASAAPVCRATSIHPEDVPAKAEPEYELRRVKRRPGRRPLANFENLPVTTQVYELRGKERLCPSCGVERQEIGGEESWQIEHLPGRFERIHHIRKKYACGGCENTGENPQMEVAAKPESAIEKGMAGPGCWPTLSPAFLGLPAAISAGRYFHWSGSQSDKSLIFAWGRFIRSWVR
jgi:zinc-finger binding domain of transposase IS66